MTTSNLREDLNNYLARNEKTVIPAKLKSTLSGINTKGFLNKFKYSPVPTENLNSSSNEWVDLSASDCCPKLSRVQRLIGFSICVSLGIFFFSAAMFLLPVLLLKARKFSLLFTLGSLFLILSFSFLWGPVNHLKHLFSKDRLIFTCTYFGTLFMTLYFAMARHSTPWTVLFAVLQLIALIWFLLSYIPGGYTGISFFTRLCSSTVGSTISKTLPV